MRDPGVLRSSYIREGLSVEGLLRQSDPLGVSVREFDIKRFQR